MLPSRLFDHHVPRDTDKIRLIFLDHPQELLVLPSVLVAVEIGQKNDFFISRKLLCLYPVGFLFGKIIQKISVDQQKIQNSRKYRCCLCSAHADLLRENAPEMFVSQYVSLIMLPFFPRFVNEKHFLSYLQNCRTGFFIIFVKPPHRI